MGLWFGSRSRDMGIDLGTANTLVYVRDKGIVLSEPSVVVIERDTNTVLAVGSEAKEMLGRTPGNIAAIRPLKDGVIADFDITQMMLAYFINKVHRRSALSHPRVVVGEPSGVTEVEKRAVTEATLQAGASEAFLIEEPMAAAVGAGLPVNEPTGSMIVDVGGGTSEVAVISLGGIVSSKSVRVGGDKMNDAITQYIRREFNLTIGEKTAEEVKMTIGCAFPLEQTKTMEVRGRDLISGLPQTVVVSSEEMREALNEPVMQIIDAVKSALERTPPELAADIIDRGIVMSGGGALLGGFPKLISEETKMPVYIAEDALSCVALGAGKVLEQLDTLQRVLLSSKKR